MKYFGWVLVSLGWVLVSLGMAFEEIWSMELATLVSPIVGALLIGMGAILQCKQWGEEERSEQAKRLGSSGE